jgi:hypothetical protein
MIGRIRIELHLMVVHPKVVAAVTDGHEFRTDSDDVRDEKGYGSLLGASYCLLSLLLNCFNSIACQLDDG